MEARDILIAQARDILVKAAIPVYIAINNMPDKQRDHTIDGWANYQVDAMLAALGNAGYRLVRA